MCYNNLIVLNDCLSSNRADKVISAECRVAAAIDSATATKISSGRYNQAEHSPDVMDRLAPLESTAELPMPSQTFSFSAWECDSIAKIES